MRTGGSIASIAAARTSASGGVGRLDGGDVQTTVAQLDAFELAVPQPAGEAFQPPVEFGAARASHSSAVAGRPSSAAIVGTAAGGSR